MLFKYSFFLLLLTAFACQNSTRPMSQDEFKARKKDMVEVNKSLVKKDQLRIKTYVERMNLSMQETKTGLWYVLDSIGSGKLVKSGNIIKLKYSVELLDGTQCYNSEIDGLKEFVVGQGGVESGLEEAVLMLYEGARAKFIMPPHLAYGLPGDDDKIPPRSIILYDLEVISIE